MGAGVDALVFFILPAKRIGETGSGATSLAPNIVSEEQFFQDGVGNFPCHLYPLRFRELFCRKPL